MLDLMHTTIYVRPYAHEVGILLLTFFRYSLSASTLSVSSTSSRGSISTGSRGSLSASSRGSLNSLCLHGEVTSSDHYSSFCHIPSNTCPPIYESHILATKAETTEGLATTTPTDQQQSAYLSNSKLSLYSRDSNQSLSPPISPLTGDLPHEILEMSDILAREHWLVSLTS